MVDIDDMLARCMICPRECGADRRVSTGYCGASADVVVNISMLHHWEEPVLSGDRGSGAIFFSHCALRCVYCQNHRISHEGRGNPRTRDELCGMMLELQERGAHNVNLVTAGHYTPQVAAAIRLAREAGLRIPVVWNSSAYEKPSTLRLLEGLVDIYLPDFRYWNPHNAARFSNAADYPAVAQAAIKEMYRQVGSLIVCEGLAVRGLIIRILVLPGMAEEAGSILAWIRRAIGRSAWVSLMGQYYPAYRAAEFPEINRGVSAEEYERCLRYLAVLGFENGFTQEVGSCDDYTPSFV